MKTKVLALYFGKGVNIQCVPKKFPFRNHSIVVNVRYYMYLWKFKFVSKTNSNDNTRITSTRKLRGGGMLKGMAHSFK